MALPGGPIFHVCGQRITGAPAAAPAARAPARRADDEPPAHHRGRLGRGLRAGADAFVRKPFDNAELVSTVGELLASAA
ncbi:MAG TPA: hypothetical protein VIK04_19560 [Solirubrobacteraceae bacterium]